MGKGIAYLEMNGKYLVMNESGNTEVLNSKEEFDTYVNKNGGKASHLKFKS